MYHPSQIIYVTGFSSNTNVYVSFMLRIVFFFDMIIISQKGR